MLHINPMHGSKGSIFFAKTRTLCEFPAVGNGRRGGKKLGTVYVELREEELFLKSGSNTRKFTAMGYNELEVELQKVQAQIGRWRKFGYMPAIEQGLALRRLQRVYAELQELPCGEQPDDTYDGLAPDDESFEPIANDTTPMAAGVVAGAEIPAATATTLSQPEPEPAQPAGPAAETHLRQDDEAHDHCPPQVDFPEAEFGAEPVELDEPAEEFEPEEPEEEEFAEEELPEEELLEEEPEAEAEEEEEEEPEPTTEFVPEPAQPAGPAAETHLRQDDEAHDPCPPQVDFPEAEYVQEPAAEQEVTFEPVAEVEEEDIEPEPTPAPEQPAEPAKPQLPKILGIEVSPYARHEIIDTLFHGNESLFEAETAKIDAMDSLEEALVYVGETFRWIPENAATIKFIDLLQSRFEQ